MGHLSPARMEWRCGGYPAPASASSSRMEPACVPCGVPALPDILILASYGTVSVFVALIATLWGDAV